MRMRQYGECCRSQLSDLRQAADNSPRQNGIRKMNHWSDLFPLVFFPFKIIVLGVGMFFAIKWHVDQDNKKREEMKQRKESSNPSA